MTGDYRGRGRGAWRRRWTSTATSAAGCGQANALYVPWGRAADNRGLPRCAARRLEEALDIYRDIGNRGGEAEALNETGTLHRVRGDPGQAAEYHRQALDLAREIASPQDEANALAGLGRCARAAGRTADAIARLRQALDIFQRIGAAEAADVAAELDSISPTTLYRLNLWVPKICST